MPESLYQQMYGMTLGYGDLGALDALPTTWTTLAGIKEFGELPGCEVGEIDVSRTDQAEAHKVFTAQKMSDAGQLALTIGGKISAINTVHGLVGVTKGFKVSFSDTSSVSVRGFIKSIKPKISNGEEMTCEITIKCSGAPTWLAAV